jgi:TctA family transporter
MEKTLRQALFMERGNVLALLGRPITLALLLLGVVALAAPLLARWMRRSGRVPLTVPSPPKGGEGS